MILGLTVSAGAFVAAAVAGEMTDLGGDYE